MILFLLMIINVYSGCEEASEEKYQKAHHKLLLLEKFRTETRIQHFGRRITFWNNAFNKQDFS